MAADRVSTAHFVRFPIVGPDHDEFLQARRRWQNHLLKSQFKCCSAI
jgi:hypothetical protein